MTTQLVRQTISEKEEKELEAKRQAAYALNLCTVSVSQIVDYNDIGILEQEYETILNNLNLEHKYSNENINIEALYKLIKELSGYAEPLEEGKKALAGAFKK